LLGAPEPSYGDPVTVVLAPPLEWTGLAGVRVHRTDRTRGPGLPEAGVIVEYEGEHHCEGLQIARDDDRLRRLVAAGWTVLHVTAAELRDPERFIAQVRALLATRTFGEGAP